MPYLEIVAAPLVIYIAPAGTAFPALDDATPDAPWEIMGRIDASTQTEDGVRVTNPQTINFVRAAGVTAPVKAFRSSEDTVVAFALMDSTLESVAALMFGPDTAYPTDVPPGAGTMGYRHMPLYKGPKVHEFALLARGVISGYMEDGIGQYEIPRAVQGENQEARHDKSNPRVIQIAVTALYDDTTSGTGRVLLQDAAATA